MNYEILVNTTLPKKIQAFITMINIFSIKHHWQHLHIKQNKFFFIKISLIVILLLLLAYNVQHSFYQNDIVLMILS